MSKKNILIDFILVILAVTAFGYFYFQPAKEVEAPEKVLIQKDAVDNWKTYTNTKYNYEFKYPDNVGIVNEETSGYAGPPSNPNEDLLLLADKEKTFYIEIDEEVVHVIKSSPLSDAIMSTFKFTK